MFMSTIDSNDPDIIILSEVTPKIIVTFYKNQK